MKKILSLILALVMMCSMATVAFAADETDAQKVQENVTGEKYTIHTTEDSNATAEGSTWTIDVMARPDIQEVTNGQVAASYYVIVEWTVNSTLTYVIDEESYTWNVWSDEVDEQGNKVLADATKEAKSAGYTFDNGSWVGQATVEVTVKNWSNKAVNAVIDFKPSTTATENVTENIVAEYNIEGEDGPYTLAIDSPAGADTVKVSEVTEVTAPSEGKATVAITKITEGAIAEKDAVIGQVTIKLTDDMGELIQPVQPQEPGGENSGT